MRMRSFWSTLFLAVCTVGLTSCETFMIPCWSSQWGGNGKPKRGTEEGELQNEERMDGTWVLQTIDGNAIPANGFKIPGKPVRVFSAYLQFVTTDAHFDDKCGELKRSNGTAVATYYTAPIAEQETSRYAGTFRRDHEANETFLSAKGHSLPVTLSTNSLGTVLTVEAEVGAFGLGVTYRLVFVRYYD